MPLLFGSSWLVATTAYEFATVAVNVAVVSLVAITDASRNPVASDQVTALAQAGPKLSTLAVSVDEAPPIIGFGLAETETPVTVHLGGAVEEGLVQAESAKSAPRTRRWVTCVRVISFRQRCTRDGDYIFGLLPAASWFVGANQDAQVKWRQGLTTDASRPAGVRSVADGNHLHFGSSSGQLPEQMATRFPLQAGSVWARLSKLSGKR